jgi:UDP-N-acetylmuramoyl-tripeptide--D-alanyl-D-alanine ligase
VLNALAAAGLALAAGAPFQAVVEGLRGAEPVKGRQVAHTLATGAVLVDDSYNANPGSVAAAIAALAEAQKRDGVAGWLVLGDMAELGEGAGRLHAEVGALARSAGLAGLWTCGRLSAEAAVAFGEGARHHASQQALIESLAAALTTGVRCLVKGSRSAAMDKVVAALLANDKARIDAGYSGREGHAA